MCQNHISTSSVSMRLPHRILLAEDKQCSQCQKTDSGYRLLKVRQTARFQSIPISSESVLQFRPVQIKQIFFLSDGLFCDHRNRKLNCQYPERNHKIHRPAFHPVNRSHKIAIADMSKSCHISFFRIFCVYNMLP